jgi:hypothetical protein
MAETQLEVHSRFQQLLSNLERLHGGQVALEGAAPLQVLASRSHQAVPWCLACAPRPFMLQGPRHLQGLAPGLLTSLASQNQQLTAQLAYQKEVLLAARSRGLSAVQPVGA